MIDFLPTPLFGQNLFITFWLSAVWVLSAGITLGFVIAIVTYFKILILQRIPVLNSVASKRSTFIVAGIGLTLVYFLLYVAVRYRGIGFLSSISWDDIRGMLFMLPICAIFGFGAWNLVSKKFQDDLTAQCTEGLPKWLCRICVIFVAFFALGFPLAKYNGFGAIKFVEKPVQMMESLARLPFAGKTDYVYSIEPSDENHSGDPVEVDFEGSELKSIFIRSTEPIELAAEPISSDVEFVLPVDPSEEHLRFQQSAGERSMFQARVYTKLYINNNGSDTAKVEFYTLTGPVDTEVAVIPPTAGFIFLCFFAPVLLAASLPKVSAISLSTFKTEISQPLYLLVLIFGAVFIVISIYIPYNTFGEDIKMFKDSGLNLIRVMAIFTAIWAASKSVAEEIEGRTALTVLSKPVSRRQFILGKFSGIAFAIGLLFIVLGLWFMIWTAYKPVYDGQESANRLTDWLQPFQQSFNVVPGLILCFFEVLIFVAVSVAISTRLGVLPNFLICATIFVLGHLTPQIVESSLGEFAPVQVFGQLIATVFPVLDHFDIQAAISRGSSVPIDYLAEVLLYTVLYSTFALLGSLVFFEDRDLA